MSRVSAPRRRQLRGGAPARCWRGGVCRLHLAEQRGVIERCRSELSGPTSPAGLLEIDPTVEQLTPGLSGNSRARGNKSEPGGGSCTSSPSCCLVAFTRRDGRAAPGSLSNRFGRLCVWACLCRHQGAAGRRFDTSTDAAIIFIRQRRNTDLNQLKPLSHSILPLVSTALCWFDAFVGKSVCLCVCGSAYPSFSSQSGR